MKGKGENKGTKRRPYTQMEQSEEKCGLWRNWGQSVLGFLWELAGFAVVVVLTPFCRNQPKPDNKVLPCIKSWWKPSPRTPKISALGPPPSSQWGNNNSWWLFRRPGGAEKLGEDLGGKRLRFLPCLSRRRSKPFRSTQKKKKNFKSLL